MVKQDGKPQMNMEADGSLSLCIEETNKLRAKLGLKPLQVTEEDKKREQEALPSQVADTEALEVQKRSEQARRRRKEREMKRIKSLGEADDDEGSEEDAASFVEKSRQRERELAEERARELEELERQQMEEMKQYDAEDLKGLEIKHDKDA